MSADCQNCKDAYRLVAAEQERNSNLERAVAEERRVHKAEVEAWKLAFQLLASELVNK